MERTTSADLNQSMQRLAATLELIRSEVAHSSQIPPRSGLAKKMVEGAAMTRAFARALNEVSDTGIDDLNFRLFSLRQGEIIFTALSRVMEELSQIESRLERLENSRD